MDFDTLSLGTTSPEAMQADLLAWDEQRSLAQQAPGVALPPGAAPGANAPASSSGLGGMGVGAWSQLAGGLVNSVANVIDGYVEKRRYEEAAKAAGDADTQNQLLRMVAYLQDQQALQRAIQQGQASIAFDPEGTGAAEVRAASEPLEDAAPNVIGGVAGMLAQRGLENRGTAEAVQRQMSEGGRRAMQPLRDFFTEAGDRRAQAATMASMFDRINQEKINDALSYGSEVQPFSDLLRMTGEGAKAAAMFI